MVLSNGFKEINYKKMDSSSIFIKISDSVAIPRKTFTAIAESALAVTSTVVAAVVSTAFTANRIPHKRYFCCCFEGYS